MAREDREFYSALAAATLPAIEAIARELSTANPTPSTEEDGGELSRPSAMTRRSSAGSA